jgi:hippurate hydrolase
MGAEENVGTYLLKALSSRVGEFVSLRREIHSNPELAFEEYGTAAMVAERLEAWGYKVERGLGGTGVVGQLVRGEGTRKIGLRADMDALPILEETGVAWASKKAGVMHACGHDGHTAMLLAAAKYLAEFGEFDGTLNMIFQPAEEGAGGAVRMMDDGLFERYPCDAIFAMHNAPGVPQGTLVFRDGPALASSDYVKVTLTGIGGHGAMPHRTADPIVAASSIILALQTVVSRNVDPFMMAVVTVGAIHSGLANNVIPATATLEISVRALDREVRKTIEQRVKALISAQAESFGVSAKIEWREGYAVLVNSLKETNFARQVGLELVGAENVILQGPQVSGSEDFAFMLERLPGCYLMIGNGADGKEGSCMVHNPAYDFNDQNLSVGGAYWVLLTERFLNNSLV